eukprot:TRINITY_DN12429_c0_g1_i4.p1 TRINITY_DN12429_c0_g1~~TRINITY_DN12429_c0_g1_i4.p1  ORF type:complete len:480 (+),score=75.69 TRINITY_DN12429_c0_g1_i4:62-1501(+)
MRLSLAVLAPLHRRFPLFQPDVVPFPHASVLASCRNSLEAADHPQIDKLPLGLYAHFPYCHRRCSYCPFNVYVRNAEKPLPLTNLSRQWREQLRRDVKVYNTDSTHRVTTMYFGGGTPFMAEAEHIADFIACSRSVMEVAPDCEITLEMNPMMANPESMKKLEELRNAGVNRISIGVQSFNKNHLGFLGRDHTPEDAARALRLVAQIFPRVSFDLLYGFPGQTVESWKEELGQALDSLPKTVKHMTIYKLNMEYGTKMYWDWKDGFFQLPSDENLLGMYHATQEVVKAADFQQYELSNYCKDDDQSRHNLLTWRGYDYLGIGPGAHGRVTVYRTRNRYHTKQRPVPAAWIDNIERYGDALVDEKKMAANQYAQELIVLGLRPVEGLCKLRFQRLIGSPVFQFIDIKGLQKCIDEGLVVDEPNRLRLTKPQGILSLQRVLSLLVPKLAAELDTSDIDRIKANRVDGRDSERNLASAPFIG